MKCCCNKVPSLIFFCFVLFFLHWTKQQWHNTAPVYYFNLFSCFVVTYHTFCLWPCAPHPDVQLFGVHGRRNEARERDRKRQMRGTYTLPSSTSPYRKRHRLTVEPLWITIYFENRPSSSRMLSHLHRRHVIQLCFVWRLWDQLLYCTAVTY